MSFHVFLACAVFSVHSVVAVLELGDQIPEEWLDIYKSRSGPIMFARDPQTCGFGYIADSNGFVLDVYDCSQFDGAFYSISYKICAVDAVLTEFGKETCDYVPPRSKFEPKIDDPLCQSTPNQVSPFPENCAQFIQCRDTESLNILTCPNRTGFNTEMLRCENLYPDNVREVCGNRQIPENWINSEP